MMVAAHDKVAAHNALAEFIRYSNDCIPESHWFTVRGDCKESLLRFTRLSTRQYATLLHVGGFIQVRGANQLRVNREEWDIFVQ